MKIKAGPLEVDEGPDVSLKALKAFAEVMHSGSATAAAKQLSLTQPAISRLISKLETTVGFELFYREKGRLVPTKDGVKLLPEVELILAGEERFNNLARSIAGFSSGTIKVVAPPSFAEAVLADLVTRFLEVYPDVEFDIDTRSSETARTMIAMRYADCGFLKLPIDDADLAAEPIVESGTICVLHQDHPLAGQSTITPIDIADHRLILLGAGRLWRREVDRAFALYGLRPRVAIETHMHGMACALASRGVGMAILNELLAKPYLHPPIVARRFDPPIIHKYGFVTSRTVAPSRLTLAFRESVTQYFSQ